MRKFLLIGAVSLASTAFTGSVFAEETHLPPPPKPASNTASISHNPTAPNGQPGSIDGQPPRLLPPPLKVGSDSAHPTFANLKDHASSLIDQRLAELQKMLSRIQASTRLQDNEKQSLATDIQTATDQLNLLKTNLTNDASDSATRQTLKGQTSVLKLQPNLAQKLNLIVITDDLSALITRIQAYIATPATNTTRIQFSADQMAKLSTDATLLSVDQTLLVQTQLSSSAAQTNFQKVRKDLMSVKMDILGIKTTLISHKPSEASASAGQIKPASTTPAELPPVQQ